MSNLYICTMSVMGGTPAALVEYTTYVFADSVEEAEPLAVEKAKAAFPDSYWMVSDPHTVWPVDRQLIEEAARKVLGWKPPEE